MTDDATAGKEVAPATVADRGFAALSAYAVFLAAIQAATIAASLAEWNVSALLARCILAGAALAGGLTYRRLRRFAERTGGVGRPRPAAAMGTRKGGHNGRRHNLRLAVGAGMHLPGHELATGTRTTFPASTSGP